MLCQNVYSTPTILKQFYNIPDRNADIPIKIGIYESLGQYIYKQDCIDFINKYGMKGVSANFDYVINNNIKFVGNDDSINAEALQVWNNGENNAGGKASLDIQIILGVSEIGLNKGDEIYIYNQSTSSLNDSKIEWSPFFQYLNSNTNSDIPKIWSISYGGDEIAAGVPSSLIDTVNKLSKNDYQIFIASGDGGSSGCRDYYRGDIRPFEPAIYPNITAVGGTNIVSCNNGKNIEIPSVASLDNDNRCSVNAGITSGGGMDGVYTDIDNNPQSVIPNFTDINEEPILELQKNIVKEYITDLESNGASYTNTELIENIKKFYNEKGFYPRAYPDISGSAEYYPIYLNGSSSVKDGTSASTPLNASMYAIIMSNLKNNNNHGKFNEYIYKAYNSGNMNVFNSVISRCSETDSNKNARFYGCESGSLQYGWGVAKNRLSTNSSATGYGFDCVIGLGSINATELQNYISSSITQIKSGITSINIKGNQLQIKYVEPDIEVEAEVEAEVEPDIEFEEEVEAEPKNSCNYEQFECKEINGKPAYMTSDFKCMECPKGQICNGVKAFPCKADEYFVNNECTECPKGQICDGTSNIQCEVDRYINENNECTECPKGQICNGVKASSCKADEYIVNNECVSCGDSLQYQGYVCNGVTKTACNKGDFVYNNECIKCPSGQLSVNGICNCGKTKLTLCQLYDSQSYSNCMNRTEGSPWIAEVKADVQIDKGPDNPGCFTEVCCSCGEIVNEEDDSRCQYLFNKQS